MKRQNKKRGFTIIELVIVVAVIAILSAVLIPTFSAVIKKSRQSADEMAVRNMNTVLAAQEADEKPDTLEELYAALAENGISAKNYKPLASDMFFFWDSQENVVVYTNADYVVQYPANVETNQENWFSLSGEIKEADIKDVVTSGATTATVDSAEEFVALAKAMKEGVNRVEDVQEITLTGDINLMGANFNFGKVENDITLKAASEVVVKGFRSDEFLSKAVNPESGLTEYGHGLFSRIPAGKTVTVENVKFVNAVVGDTEPTGKNSQFGFIAGSVEGTLIVKNVTFENCSINGCQKVGVVAGQVQSAGKVQMTKVTATNCTVTGAMQAARAIGVVGKTNEVTATADCDFSGVTVGVATGATWTELWQTNGTPDKNWNGEVITVADLHNFEGGFYAKYLNGTAEWLFEVYANTDYWQAVEAATTTVGAVTAKYSCMAKNF